MQLWEAANTATREASLCLQLSVTVHLLEEGLSKLIGANHNSTGRGHFDHPGQET